MYKNKNFGLPKELIEAVRKVSDDNKVKEVPLTEEELHEIKLKHAIGTVKDNIGDLVKAGVLGAGHGALTGLAYGYHPAATAAISSAITTGLGLKHAVGDYKSRVRNDKILSDISKKKVDKKVVKIPTRNSSEKTYGKKGEVIPFKPREGVNMEEFIEDLALYIMNESHNLIDEDIEELDEKTSFIDKITGGRARRLAKKVDAKRRDTTKAKSAKAASDRVASANTREAHLKKGHNSGYLGSNMSKTARGTEIKKSTKKNAIPPKPKAPRKPREKKKALGENLFLVISGSMKGQIVESLGYNLTGHDVQDINGNFYHIKVKNLRKLSEEEINERTWTQAGLDAAGGALAGVGTGIAIGGLPLVVAGAAGAIGGLVTGAQHDKEVSKNAEVKPKVPTVKKIKQPAEEKIEDQKVEEAFSRKELEHIKAILEAKKPKCKCDGKCICGKMKK